LEQRVYEHDFSRINVTITEIAIEPATPKPFEKKKNIAQALWQS